MLFQSTFYATQLFIMYFILVCVQILTIIGLLHIFLCSFLCECLESSLYSLMCYSVASTIIVSNKEQRFM